MATAVLSKVGVGAGRDYATLDAWKNARRGNLVTRDTIEIAWVYGGGSVGDCWLEAGEWTTDPEHYVWILAAPGHGHGGRFDTAKAYVAGLTDNPLWVHVPWTRVGPGLVVDALVDLGGIVGGPHGVLVADIPAGKYCVVDGVIARTSNATCFRAEYCDPATPQLFRNCVAIRHPDNPTTGVRATNATVRATNCTIITGDTGLMADNDGGAFGNPANPGRVISENNYLGAGTCYGAPVGSGSSIDKGLSDATSDSSALDATLRGVLAANEFLDPFGVTPDFHLKPASILVGRGQTAHQWGVVQDFEGELRATPLDVGADEIYKFVEGAPGWTVPEGGKIWSVP